MNVVLIIIVIILLIAGFVGCIVPAMPGVPIAYVSLVVLRFSDKGDEVSNRLLIIWAIVTIIVTVLDYIVPAWGTKQFGGSKWGTWGSAIGVIVGLFFGPWGIILGPFLGAVLFELIGGKPSKEAIRAGWGSFIGFLTGTILKLICCGLMTWQAIAIIV